MKHQACTPQRSWPAIWDKHCRQHGLSWPCTYRGYAHNEPYGSRIPDGHFVIERDGWLPDDLLKRNSQATT